MFARLLLVARISTTTKVPFPPVRPHRKIGRMELPHFDQAADIASAYLKELRKHGGEKIQKPELQAWLKVEERLMLGSAPSRPREVKPPLSRPTTTVNKTPKKPQSIWNRPISELWR